MKKLKSIMFVGTGSDVGKSIISTGFCRLLKQDGYHPAPFKAQNMSLNSFATPDGFEIGRAQAVQAEACGIACSTDMNPVLLKPTSDKSSQVVLNGKPIGTQTAYEYFMGNNRGELLKQAMAAYDRLSVIYNPIVMEGAGSISEINLKHRDITNMRMAAYTGADTYLVADIDKGGVFGSVYGTMTLLPSEERKLIKGIIINKFRGDASLFEEGRKMMEDLCGIPVTGVVPYLPGLSIEEEDSVALHQKSKFSVDGKVNIGVVLLKRMANYTDFKVLENDDRVNLFYSDQPAELEAAHVVVIPGSKNTIADLIDIKNSGVGKIIVKAVQQDKTVIGICGGYQMMGLSVSDPHHIEGDVDFMTGLGIFPVETVLSKEKLTRQCTFAFKKFSSTCQGYEIHMGISEGRGPGNGLNLLIGGAEEGYLLHDRCWGTYVHGILDNNVVIEDLLAPYTQKVASPSYDHVSFKESQYDKLAAHLRQHLDIASMYEHLFC
jgi:adenosylcobyric acid synthase